jgi:hypothetical protein
LPGAGNFSDHNWGISLILDSYAQQAGVADYEVAPIENDFLRFYLLTP